MSLMVGNVVVSVAGSEAGVAIVNGVTGADISWRLSSVDFAQSVGTASAEIAGTPIQRGIFIVRVVGGNSSSETDKVDIVYDICTDKPPAEPVTAIINADYKVTRST